MGEILYLIFLKIFLVVDLYMKHEDFPAVCHMFCVGVVHQISQLKLTQAHNIQSYVLLETSLYFIRVCLSYPQSYVLDYQQNISKLF